MKHSGPLGVPRLTGIGPFVSESSQDGRIGAVPIPEDNESDEEFMERCKKSKWATEYANGLIESYDMQDTDETRSKIKEEACSGLLDEEVPEPKDTKTSLNY